MSTAPNVFSSPNAPQGSIASNWALNNSQTSLNSNDGSITTTASSSEGSATTTGQGGHTESAPAVATEPAGWPARPPQGTDARTMWAPGLLIEIVRQAWVDETGEEPPQSTSAHTARDKSLPPAALSVEDCKESFRSGLQQLKLTAGCTSNRAELNRVIFTRDPRQLAKLMIAIYRKSDRLLKDDTAGFDLTMIARAMHTAYETVGLEPNMDLTLAPRNSSEPDLPSFLLNTTIVTDITLDESGLGDFIEKIDERSVLGPSSVEGNPFASFSADISSLSALFNRTHNGDPAIPPVTSSPSGGQTEVPTPKPPREVEAKVAYEIPTPHVELIANVEEYRLWTTRSHWEEVASSIIEAHKEGFPIDAAISNHMHHLATDRIAPKIRTSSRLSSMVCGDEAPREEGSE